MSLGDVVGNGNGCPPHLAGQGVLFLWWELLEKTVGPLPEFSSYLVQLEIIESKTPVINRHHSPLTTHHSPNT
jgi:hypothetical protein